MSAELDATVAALAKIVEVQTRVLTSTIEAMGRMAAQQPAPAPARDPFELARDALQMVRELDAGGARDPEPGPGPAPTSANPWVHVADRAASLLERFLDQQDRRPRAPAGAEASANGKHLVIPRWLAPLAPYLPYLAKWADEGVDPGSQASMVAEQLPADARAAVLNVVKMDGYPLAVINAVPQLAQRAQWMTTFLFQLRSELLRATDGGTDVGEIGTPS